MNSCKQCGSYAINHSHHGRDGSDPDLCDVCYWRKRANRKPLTEWRTIETAQIGKEVIVWSEFDGVCAGVLDSYGDWYVPYSEYKLTRVRMWMPLPPPPPIEAAHGIKGEV